MAEPDQGGPVTTNPRLERIVRSAVVENLRARLFFPKNLLTMLLEQAGIYQNFAGIVIEAMVQEGRAKLFTHREAHPVLASPMLNLASLREEEMRSRDETLHHLDRIMEMQGDSAVCGFFNELVLHVAFADYFTSNNPPPVSAYFRKGKYSWLSRFEADSALVLGGEFFFIEMKNWLKQAQDKSTAIRDGKEVRLDNPELSKLFALTEPGLNPILIDRSSSGRLKKRIWGPLDGRVCDLDYLNILDLPRLEGAKESTEFFGINRMVNWIDPPIFEGELLDGERFNNLVRRTGDGHILTLRDLAGMREMLPENVKSKVRGLIRVLYLVAKHHVARREGRVTDRVGWLLVEYSYNYLLGAKGRYRDIEELLTYAESRLTKDFPELVTNYRRFRKEHADSLLTRLQLLKEWKFLTTRSGSYVVRDAVQPETWNLARTWQA